MEAVDNDRIEVWVRKTKRWEDEAPVYSVNWRSIHRGLETHVFDHPKTIADALIWLGTKMKLEGEKNV